MRSEPFWFREFHPYAYVAETCHFEAFFCAAIRLSGTFPPITRCC